VWSRTARPICVTGGGGVVLPRRTPVGGVGLDVPAWSAHTSTAGQAGPAHTWTEETLVGRGTRCVRSQLRESGRGVSTWSGTTASAGSPLRSMANGSQTASSPPCVSCWRRSTPAAHRSTVCPTTCTPWPWSPPSAPPRMPTGDPAGSVTFFSPKRAAHLDEHVLGEAEIDDGRPTRSRRLEQDHIGPPVEAGIPHHDAGQPAQLAADHRAQPRHRRHKHPGHAGLHRAVAARACRYRRSGTGAGSPSHRLVRVIPALSSIEAIPKPLHHAATVSHTPLLLVTATPVLGCGSHTSPRS
jgi:hypothetical protein